ncbi:hypothetical protein K239x_05650 [Planctomycetes bacterium K23_9]|uniref:Uncharacterized protein n=1 Tax=Stieleria marina TaxID=1930275 RepID=A0A517NNB9_9BACT|nr:hypothetical protein K239x_05650 [Planctomycetes bacterium K23_9]
MKLQVRKLFLLGVATTLFTSTAPSADAGGLLAKLFKCKAEEPTCCCEPEPACCEPAPEPACCEPEPEPVCCEPAPDPVCCEAAPEPVCCEPEPAPEPCCASVGSAGYSLPELAPGEVLLSISPISAPSTPMNTSPPTQFAAEPTSVITQLAAK